MHPTPWGNGLHDRESFGVLVGGLFDSFPPNLFLHLGMRFGANHERPEDISHLRRKQRHPSLVHLPHRAAVRRKASEGAREGDQVRERGDHPLTGSEADTEVRVPCCFDVASEARNGDFLLGC